MKFCLTLLSSFCAMVLFALVVSSARADEEAEKQEEPSKRPANGAEAPPLDVAAWNDGQQHTLADYRGKVVVLHFWGTWCQPCIATIPLWKQLEEKYKDQDVVFLGIHTAGSTTDEVNQFLKKHDWPHLTAIDAGKERPDSATFGRYGVSAVNQIAVVDKTGRIACNGRDFPHAGLNSPEGAKRIAEQLGVEKGFFDKNATEDEQRDAAIKFFTYVYGSEIDAARKTTR